jgi:hypothetical protein
MLTDNSPFKFGRECVCWAVVLATDALPLAVSRPFPNGLFLPFPSVLPPHPFDSTSQRIHEFCSALKSKDQIEGSPPQKNSFLLIVNQKSISLTFLEMLYIGLTI